MIKHATASVFVFHRDPRAGWRVGLIEHPIFGAWMQPGGHVEESETPLEAALREAHEETGLDGLRLVNVHEPPPLTRTATTIPMALPVWVVEHPIPGGDNHVADAHVHIDHKYLAITDSPESVTTPAHPFAWFTRDQVADVKTLDDVRDIATVLFELVRSPNPATSGP